jgi:hypothetical protein
MGLDVETTSDICESSEGVAEHLVVHVNVVEELRGFPRLLLVLYLWGRTIGKHGPQPSL